MLIIGVIQVAVKAIRPVIENEEEYQVKKKVTFARAQGLLRFPYFHTPARLLNRNSEYG